MATKKVLVEIEVKQSGGKIPKIGKEIDGLTSAQKKYNNALQDNIDAHSEYSKSTQKMKKESAETRRQMTLEEANVIKLTKAQERLAFEQSDLGKEYAKTNIQARLQKLSNQELAIEQMKLAESTEHATDKMQQFKTTAGLSGAIVTEFGRTISDLPYGIRGVGNNVSQLVTLFGLFTQNVAKAGGTMRDGFKLLFSQMTGVIGLMTGLQIVIAGFQSGVIQGFISSLFSAGERFKTLNELAEKSSQIMGNSIGVFKSYIHILNRSNLTEKERLDTIKKINEEYPDFDASIYSNVDAQEAQNKATERYIELLSERARSEAAQAMLNESEAKVFEARIKQELKTEEDINEIQKLQEGANVRAIISTNELIEATKEGAVTDEQIRKRAILIRQNNVNAIIKADKEIIDSELKKQEVLRKFIKPPKSDEDTSGGGKSVSIFKARLLDLSKLEERFRQESKKSEIKTEEELIKEKAQFAKDDLDITINSFIEKEKLRLKEFIDKQELKKKEKNADVNLINQSIANAKIKTSQSIKLAKQEADGVIEQINNVEKSELILAERRSAERLREEQEKKEVTDREIAQLERQIERANELVEKDESGKITGTTPVSKLSNKLEEDALFIQSEIDRESALLDNEALSDLQRAEIQKRRTEREKELAENRVLYAQAEQNAKEQMLTQTAGLLSASAALAEKDSATQKALAITSTIVSTYSAAQKAYESQFSPVPTASSPVRASIAAATAVAKGLANVKAITSGGKSSPSQGGGATTVKRQTLT